MSKSPWRTIALCATCAVLAGAGSAALADSPTAQPAKPPEAKIVGTMDPAQEARARKLKCEYAREHKIPQADEICSGKPDGPGVSKRVNDCAPGDLKPGDKPGDKPKEGAPPGDPAIKAPPAAL